MLHIRQMIQKGLDTAQDIYNTAMRDERLRTGSYWEGEWRIDIMTFEEMEGIRLDLPMTQFFDEFNIEIVPLHGYYANKKFLF